MRKVLLATVIILILFSIINRSKSLFDIVSTGTSKKVQKAIKEGANVNDTSSYGWTPMMIAASHNPNPEVITVLAEAGANVNDRDSDGSTPLMEAIFCNRNPEVVTALIKAGANVNDRDSAGQTPLMHAVEYEDLDKVTTLINGGANVNDQNHNGLTPLMIAAMNNLEPEVITILLKSGANGTQKSNEGKTAFDYAKDNESIKGTNAYWELNDAQYK